MKRRLSTTKPATTKRVPSSTRPAQKPKPKKLSEADAVATYHHAKANGKLISVTHLVDILRGRKEDSVAKFVEFMREELNSPELDQGASQLLATARLMEFAVGRFGELVEEGHFDTVLPNLSSLPTSYSPFAGKGASGWERAREIFDTKGIGTQARLTRRGTDSQTARYPLWGKLAQLAVDVVTAASTDVAELENLKASAVAYCDFERRRPRARKTIRTRFYVFADGRVLHWPPWLALCADLPARVRTDVKGYRRAVAAVVDEFFADPKCVEADRILQPRVARKFTRPEAVNEARKAILAAMTRL